MITTGFQSNLAGGRFAILSPLEAVNAFVRRMLPAGTFARGSRQTMRYALMRINVRCKLAMDRHVPSKVSLPVGDLDSGPHLIYGSLDQCESVPQTASRLVQPFLYSSPAYPTHTDTQTTLRTTSAAIIGIGRKYALRVGDEA